MRKIIRVNPKTHMMCIPNEIAEDGMVGDVESFPNAVTLSLVMPGADLEDVEASLERTLEDIRHRMRFAERVKDNPESRYKRESAKPPYVEARGGENIKHEFDALRKKIKGG
jgi:hypothetical protein